MDIKTKDEIVEYINNKKKERAQELSNPKLTNIERRMIILESKEEVTAVVYGQILRSLSNQTKDFENMFEEVIDVLVELESKVGESSENTKLIQEKIEELQKSKQQVINKNYNFLNNLSLSGFTSKLGLDGS